MLLPLPPLPLMAQPTKLLPLPEHKIYQLVEPGHFLFLHSLTLVKLVLLSLMLAMHTLATLPPHPLTARELSLLSGLRLCKVLQELMRPRRRQLQPTLQSPHFLPRFHTLHLMEH